MRFYALFVFSVFFKMEERSAIYALWEGQSLSCCNG